MLALAVAFAGALAIAVLPHSDSRTPGISGFAGPPFAGSPSEQRDFARDHVRSEPQLFVNVENAPAPSLAARPLL
jgi:hypothetical protein